MNFSDIVYAQTIKEKPGFCEVCYYDGTKIF